MPCMPNWQYSAMVGQDKKYQDVVDLFNDKHGRYDCCSSDEAKVKPGGNKPSVHKQVPFNLKK